MIKTLILETCRKRCQTFTLYAFNVFLIFFIVGCDGRIKNYVQIDSLPIIFPDYTSLTIPYNIAPLNFNIEEKAEEYRVEIYSEKGKTIILQQNSSNIQIPIEEWHKILESNKSQTLKIDVYSKRDKWYKYQTIIDTIASAPIDSTLVYRLLGIVHTEGDKMGIYQRKLDCYEQTILFENNTNPKTPCVNCHAFSNNQPEKMSMHVRKAYGGTVIFDHGKYIKYNTRTQQAIAPAAYTAWHPNGNLIAFSVNRLFVYFTSDADKLVEVADQVSDLVIFDTQTHTFSSSKNICTTSRENLPNWSPDGKWLYYINAPFVTKNMSSWINSKYDLMRVGFDTDSMTWGKTDTLLTSEQTGKSITWPAVSQDGKYIVFCMIDHSYFSIFDKNSDLYLFNIDSRQYRKLDVLNSETTESYHSWSSNGRWLTFSSKRLDEVSTRPFFSYFDSTGNFHKPFVLPQEDPMFYITDKYNFNMPVFVTGGININCSEFQKFITENASEVHFDSTVPIDTTGEFFGYSMSH